MISTLNATLMTVALCIAPSLTAQGDVKGPPSGGGKGATAGRTEVAPPEIKFQKVGPADLAIFLKKHPKVHAEVKALADTNQDGKLDEIEKARAKAMVMQRHKQWMLKRRGARQEKRAELRDKLADRRRELRRKHTERAKKIHDRLDRNDDGKVGPRERQRAKKVHDRLDRNDDGRVGPRERQRAKKVHDRLDRNDDGRVGPRERQRAKKVRNRVQTRRQR